MGKYAVFLFCVTTLFFNCSSDYSVAPKEKQILIQGHLCAYKPVNDIRVTELITYEHGQTNVIVSPINNAQVMLIKINQRYELNISPGDSGYYHYQGSDLTVEPGDTFHIEVNYHNNVATATTVVPPDVNITKISKDTLWIPDRIDFYVLRLKYLIGEAILINWSSKEDHDAHYFPVIAYIDTVKSTVQPLRNINTSLLYNDPDPYDLQNSLEDMWSTNKFYIFPQFVFDHFKKEGKYCFYVYRVHEEYVGLYYTSYLMWDSKYTSYSNINNGLGIFTALNGDSTFFYVKKE